MQTQKAAINTVSETHQLHTGTISMFLRLIISILPDDHQCALYTWWRLCIIVLKLGSWNALAFTKICQFQEMGTFENVCIQDLSCCVVNFKFLVINFTR